MEVEMFGAARRAAGLTVDKAALACGVSRPTYNERERYPLDFRLGELVALHASLDPIGRQLLVRAVNSAFEEPPVAADGPAALAADER